MASDILSGGSHVRIEEMQRKIPKVVDVEKSWKLLECSSCGFKRVFKVPSPPVMVTCPKCRSPTIVWHDGDIEWVDQDDKDGEDDE